MIDKDSHIINRVLDGDMDSFRTLMDSYSQRVFALVVRIVDNEADAEEITQDVFLKVYKNLARFDGRSMFSSWLYRIAYNESISHTRKGRREVAVEESLLRAVSDSTVDALLDSGDARLAALPEALDRLGAEERAIITLYYMEGLPMKEVADIMRISESNAKVRLMRTRKKLYVLITQITKRYEIGRASCRERVLQVV